MDRTESSSLGFDMLPVGRRVRVCDTSNLRRDPCYADDRSSYCAARSPSPKTARHPPQLAPGSTGDLPVAGRWRGSVRVWAQS